MKKAWFLILCGLLVITGCGSSGETATTTTTATTGSSTTVSSTTTTDTGSTTTVSITTTTGGGPTTSTVSTSTTTTTFNPATAKVVFTVYNGSDKNVYVMNLDSTNRTALTTDNVSWTPLLTPDKSQILYQKNSGELYIINIDGGGNIMLSGNAIEQAVTPDGTKIYYAYYDGALQIWQMNLDGSSPAAVTDIGTDTWGPKILPSGDKFLFASNAAEVTAGTTLEDVYIANLNGSGIQRLTSSEGTYNNYYPTLSPSGTSFVYFSSVSGGNSELYLMNIDGSGKTLISTTEASYTASNGEPSFSPDGTKVAFHSNRTGSFEVYRVDIDGSGLVQLTTTGGDNYKPQYLPNGQILFYTERDGRPQLYTMEADGSNQIKLSDGSADDGDGSAYTTEKPSF